MVQAPQKAITLAEFLRLPETKPASQYIDGQINQKPMPQGKHSVLQGEIVANFSRVLRPNRIAYAFPELRCTFGGRSIVPDVVVLLWANIPLDPNGEIANEVTQAPDWAIEVLSPNQSPTKVVKNLMHCLQQGTQLGWLIDPAEQTVFVYLPDQRVLVFDVAEQLLPVPAFATDLQITVGELFGWLKTFAP
ncbi:MAG: Uma2 family endonuclease [Synechococcales cyanobacterium CRU_2_2]|nr:Uma2 family endonuclease [Synechococcales cyanobacterium CRU_2_2]